MSDAERNGVDEAMETALRKFTAVPTDGPLRERVAAALMAEEAMPRRVWGDRALRCVMTMGAAAAALIVTLQVMDYVERRGRASSPPAEARAPEADLGDVLAALAAGKDPFHSPAMPH